MTYAEQFPAVELPPKPEESLAGSLSAVAFEYNEAVVATRKHAMALRVDMMTPTIDEASPSDQLTYFLARAVLDDLIPMKQRTLMGSLMGGW